MLKQEVDAKSPVTLAEAAQLLRKDPKSFEHGETFTLQTISIIPPDRRARGGGRRAQKGRRHSGASEATKITSSLALLRRKVSEDDFRVDMATGKW